MQSLTVFTPTFNRANTLPRAYEALKRQTSKDFIWMIIDDGSTDNTKDLVDSWVKNDNDFEIKYIYKDNGGLHTGYNCAIENAHTELMVCVDSDDFMPDNAVEIILDFWNKNGSDEYAGIVGLDYDLDENIIGDKLPNQKSVNLIDLLIGKYKLYNGDRTNVVRTDVYKSVAPMKSIDGEKNFNPHYLHLLISKKYDFLVMNQNLKFVEYQQGGMTDSVFKQYCNSPNSYIELRKLNLSLNNAPLVFKIKNILHYISSCLIANKKHIVRDCPKKFLCFALMPLGFLFSKYVLKKGRG